MTSIFAKVEGAIEADAEAAYADLKVFFTDDVWPIVKATLQYIETNGGQDLLTIAENAVKALINGLETGTSLSSALGSVVGTVIDEAKSAGIAVTEAAATLALNLAATKVAAVQAAA